MSLTPSEIIQRALDAGPTPGEWELRFGSADSVFIKGGVRLCTFMPRYDDADRSSSEDFANARLIAACNPVAIAALLAELKRLRGALNFYADPARHHGANQRLHSPDKFTPEGGAYLQDVIRDNGDIARAALKAQP